MTKFESQCTFADPSELTSFKKSLEFCLENLKQKYYPRPVSNFLITSKTLINHFLDPREPKNSSLDTSRDSTEIVITGASSSPVEAEVGLIDEYDLQSITPNDGTNDGPVAVSATLTLRNLTSGTVYAIELKSKITACSGVESLNYTSIVECTGKKFLKVRNRYNQI